MSFVSQKQVVLCPLPEEATIEYLTGIRNLDHLKDQYGLPYRHIKRSVNPRGIFLHPFLALKRYHMIRETEPLPQNLVDGLDVFLLSEIESENIRFMMGLGFTILSQGFLSINIWGRGNVLFTQTYTVEANYPILTREPLEKTGVACTWEAKIMQHEYELWHEYITSTRDIENKKKYIQTFIEGKLW